MGRRRSSTSRATSVARSDATAGAAAPTASADSLRPYSSQPSARARHRLPACPAIRLRHEQPVPTREVVPQPRSRNYFPGMRASRAIQQPVTLTARSTGVRHICTPSRSQMIGAAAAHR